MGWTDLKPLGRAALEANQKDLSGGAPGVLAGAPRDFRSLSLFSGCGVLDYASPWCAPVCYCEKDPAAISVLRARMADKSLPEAPVIHDVREVTPRSIAGPIDVLVAGFHCVDVPLAGGKRGLQGTDSSLLWELFRIARKLVVPMLFLGNVNNLRFMTEFWGEMLGALADLGFQTQWVSLSAASVGSPQRRRRIFMLAKRGSALAVKFGPALPPGAF